ncbi:hypothetical protein [Rhizobium leguminosarum]|uniref:hypothetical protein n=1 Tax=Rhizobium leguminosarum TaxID=384 RepID=UPI00143F5595|nr:hypothetical protein [Rhizobium leguminosarum]NKL25024.1 hypothetical protein [Rhizobium leguminosarum bv. viciae]
MPIAEPFRNYSCTKANLVPPIGIERVRHRRNPDQETENLRLKTTAQYQSPGDPRNNAERIGLIF